jgi:hypothetical protein
MVLLEFIPWEVFLTESVRTGQKCGSFENKIVIKRKKKIRTVLQAELSLSDKERGGFGHASCSHTR